MDPRSTTPDGPITTSSSSTFVVIAAVPGPYVYVLPPTTATDPPMTVTSSPPTTTASPFAAGGMVTPGNPTPSGPMEAIRPFTTAVVGVGPTANVVPASTT